MSNLTPIEGPMVWKGPDIDYRNEGVRVLSTDEIDEIDTALEYLHSRGEIDFPDITPAMFPLPALGRFLGGLADELRYGRGFLLLRGLPRARYSLDDMARIYYGLGAHIGRPVPQSYQGELLGHVIDVSDVEAQARGYHKGGSQRMHSDNCDIVSLTCVRSAKSGGISRFVSAAAVHNRLLEERPDLLETLYGQYVFRRMELDAEFGTGYLVKKVVIFSRANGEFTCNVSGSYPHRAVKAGDAVMTPLQIEALEELKRISSLPELYLDMTIAEGDMQFLNNRTILHGRTGYDDWPEMARRRHLMRLWLHAPSWPRLPANQGVHTPEDPPLWLRQRQKLMEQPSRYLAEMARRQEGLMPLPEMAH
ncbi:MAG TPA: TauD/TfdA family dioxygenase [Stellaceae bacterium]|jgi:alpha-ketoglutarate-dependent taurine dioxygenase|nr:TauD/TfdA family dioxygenase [Stellaceae bacterium]